MKKIIVTGGAGFIGSHLVDHLVSLGHRVLVVDNLSTGKREQIHPEAEFIRMDVLEQGLSDVFLQFRPEAVYHLAAQVSVFRSIEQPLMDAQINIMGTLAVLNACKAAVVRKFIYASSAAVYGYPEEKKIQEKHVVKPLSFYGISKHTPEHYTALYRDLFGLDYTVLRYANVYGGRQDAQGEGGVVSIFASKLLLGEQPIIYGTGEQTRDFIYVRDIVAANIAALEKGGGLTMNISSNSSVSINGLLREMCSMCEIAFSPRYDPARSGDIQNSVLDNRMALQELKWSPVYSLRDGLKETLQSYQSVICG
ncbi:NAD-dependent epimerase/dehydratase family protein [Cohnella sp.]|uniref:NAD-dependent epimerase/dehydratase family protein n=1 Tax=Cohnella sp. TaxID=1883426 RepID=UPI0035651FE8